jgi:fibronectin-binding autotransporter adhesin
MATWYAQASAVSFFHVSGGTTSDVWYSTSSGTGGAYLDLSTNYSADTFNANGKTSIAIDANVTAALLTAAGNAGTFLINTNGVTITANLAAGTAAGSFAMTSGTPTVAVAGSITGGSSSSDFCVDLAVAGTLNVTVGPVTGGSNATGIAIYNSVGAAIVNVTGNVLAAAAPAIQASSSGTTVTVTNGNIVDTGTVSAIARISNIVFVPGAANYYDMRTTGAAVVRLHYDVPALASILASDTLDNVAGTFVEADRNTDPGEVNVKSATAYKILNVAKSGSYSAAGGLLINPGLSGGLR